MRSIQHTNSVTYVTGLCSTIKNILKKKYLQFFCECRKCVVTFFSVLVDGILIVFRWYVTILIFKKVCQVRTKKFGGTLDFAPVQVFKHQGAELTDALYTHRKILDKCSVSNFRFSLSF